MGIRLDVDPVLEMGILSPLLSVIASPVTASSSTKWRDRGPAAKHVRERSRAASRNQDTNKVAEGLTARTE